MDSITGVGECGGFGVIGAVRMPGAAMSTESHQGIDKPTCSGLWGNAPE